MAASAHHIWAAIASDVSTWAGCRNGEFALEETPAVQSEPKAMAEPSRAPALGKPARRLPLANILSFVVGLVGIAAIGAAAWVYVETQRDIARISTDIAQFRLSLELYGQRNLAGDTATGSDGGLLDLSNRIAILEQNWRNSIVAPGDATDQATPTTGFTPPPAQPVASDGDCLPTGTRFLVTSGDSYPVCGIAGSVEIGGVDNGFLSLADGTIIASGGNIGLPGTACMIGVVSAGEDGMTGFAEIRVTC